MIYLITNCTNAKKTLPKSSFLLRNYNFLDISKVEKKWSHNLLNASKNNLLQAKEMYKGLSWKAILHSTENFSKKFKTKLLVASAGYGLIDSNDFITSYGSTFSKGSLDSVHNFSNDSINKLTTIWWDKINRFDINRVEPKNSFIFLAVSYEYLLAMEHTIDNLLDTFGNRVFIVLASQNRLPKKYNKNILNFDLRFNSYQPGTLTTLLARCMKWLSNEIIIKNLTLEHTVLQNRIDKFLLNYTQPSVISREQVTDDKISLLIEEQILYKNIKSATSGLKNLRLNGYACEQQRFANLFKIIYERVNKNG